jgi:hypothetical protein
MVMKNPIFWGTTPCSPLKVNRCFGGIYRLHPQGLSVSQARNQREACSEQSQSPIFWNIMPCSPLINRRFGGILVSLLAYFSTLKAICSSETSANFKQITRRYIPENRTHFCSLFLTQNIHFWKQKLKSVYTYSIPVSITSLNPLIFTARWLLHVSPILTFKNFWILSVYMGFVRF